jgi:hypothetical protein
MLYASDGLMILWSLGILKQIKSFVLCLVINVDLEKKGMMNLCSNNESTKFLLHGA